MEDIMNQYLSSASLKTLAKGQLLGKYGTVIAAYLIHLLCIFTVNRAISLLIGTGTIIGILLSAIANFLLSLFSGYFLAGEAFIYLKIACNQRPLVSDLFHFFRGDTSKVISIQIITAGVTSVSFLPSTIVAYFLDQSLALRLTGRLTETSSPDALLFLLFVVLLLIAAVISIYVDLMLSQAFYLMLDFPDYPASRIIRMSIQLMKGNKGRLLYIELSFIPLLLLGGISCGIGLLWLLPYMAATYANFYLDLVRKKPLSE